MCKCNIKNAHIKNNECVNKYISGRTIKQWLEDNKEDRKKKQEDYKMLNIEQIRKWQNQYREDHREEIKQKKAEYRENNRDYINQQQRNTYEKNKGKYAVKVECCCGASVAKYNIRRHERTPKHQDYMKALTKED